MNIKAYFTNRAIHKFLRSLAPALNRRYSGSAPFTEGQITTTIEALKLNQKYTAIALGVFGSGEIIEGFEGYTEEIKQFKGYSNILNDYGSDAGGSYSGGSCDGD